MSYQTRLTLTVGLFVVLAGACSAAQQKAVHDVLDGVHGYCESVDPNVQIVLERIDSADGGGNDSASRPR